MTEKRIFDIAGIKKDSADHATKTPFFETADTGGSVWVIRPGQTLTKHRHTNADDVWIVLEGEGVFYPAPDKEVPFHAGQVIVSGRGECHGAKNTGTTDVVFVSIVAPVPSDYEPLSS